MAFEPRDNSGLIAKNERKEKENHPDQSGTCMIDGREYWISGWIKQGSKGKFLSLAFKPKEQKSQQTSSRRVKADDGLDNDIPF